MKYQQHSEREMLEKIGGWINVPKIKILNPERMAQLQERLEMLQRMLADEYIEATIEIYPCPLDTGNIIIRMDMDDFVVRNIKKFADILSVMSNFEIYPLRGNRIRFSMVYGKAMSVIPNME